MNTKIIDQLKSGKVGVIPTDTIYGIVGSALNPEVVEKIYNLRKRSKNKPMIILISQLSDLEKFEINLTETQKELLKKVWPNPVSVVLPCASDNFKYLHRGTNTLAFRMPNDDDLLETLKVTEPLVAPSANFEGQKPSQTIDEAKRFFGDEVDFYINGGRIISKPSTLIKLNEDGSTKILREGSFKLN